MNLQFRWIQIEKLPDRTHYLVGFEKSSVRLHQENYSLLAFVADVDESETIKIP